MVRGIEFSLRKHDHEILKKLFGGFDVNKYTWDVFNEQAWDENYKCLFENRTYCGDEFRLALLKPASIVMLIQFYAFEGCVKNIESYEDYLLSDCKLMFFVIDESFIDIYCKEKEDLDYFFNTAVQLNVKFLEYITDKNDKRTGYSFRD